MPPSLLARGLGPLIGTLWTLFLVWTALVAALWLAGNGWVAQVPNAGLRSALGFFVSAADVFWLLLASGNLYLYLAEAEGLVRARRHGLSIAVAAAAIGIASSTIGYPLGWVLYTGHFGPKFGSLTLGWPLLWFTVLIGSHGLATRLFPRSSHGRLAAITGGFALLTDLNLEPIATKFRFFWFWYQPETRLPTGVPWTNYLAWFTVATALAWTLRDQRLASAQRPNWRPAEILLTFNGVLILGHLRMAFTG